MTAPSQPVGSTAGPASHVVTGDAAHTRGRRAALAAAFRLLAAALAVGVVVQVFLAGLGVFGAHGVDLDQAASLDAHRAWGDVLGLVAVLLFLLGLLARAPRRLLAATFAVAVLTEVAQHGLAEAGLRHSWAGGLHAADGALILLIAVFVAVTAPNPRHGTVVRPGD